MGLADCDIEFKLPTGRGDAFAHGGGPNHATTSSCDSDERRKTFAGYRSYWWPRQQRGDRGAEEGLRNPDSNAARAVASAWMLALANDRRAAKLSQLIEDTRGEQAANDLRRPASDA